MNSNDKKISYMTVNEAIALFLEFVETKNKQSQIYECISQDPIDYGGLYSMIDILDEDDVSLILKYDKDYSVTFLLSLVGKAYEDDLTKQAIYLLRRHNLNYILPLLPHVDEEAIREEYSRFYRKKVSSD